MSRRPMDYYPTPPDTVAALHGWLRRAGWLGEASGWLDPAAGFGALLEGIPVAVRAIEMDPSREADLRRVASDVTIADALAVEWPENCCIVSNPPFNLLDAFVARIFEHVRRPGRFVVGCVLTRVQWIDEGDRAAKWRPDIVLRMPWRQSFTGDGKADSTTHCWLVYLSGRGGSTAVEWLPRPLVSDEAWARFQVMTRDACGMQGCLDLAGGARG